MLGLSPHARISQVPIEQIRQFLLEHFQRWIIPKAIRSDNGEPFGVPTRDVVPLMSLWLKAWDITPILNRPRRPTDNSKVERGQGTTSRWAELSKCANLNMLQQQLDNACLTQREKYPVVRLGKVTRSQLHKSLTDKTRPFDQAIFDEKKAYALLSLAVMPRKVSINGTIVIYNKVFSVGVSHKRKIMMVKFDPIRMEWVVIDQVGVICTTIPEPRFYRESLFNLRCQ